MLATDASWASSLCPMSDYTAASRQETASVLIRSKAVLFEGFRGTKMRTAYRVMVFGSFAALLLLSSCKKKVPPSEAAAAAAAAGPQDPALIVSPGGYHGKHASGPVYIPRSSPMIDGTTAYDVTYQDGVTVVSKDDTMRHLLTIQEDGSYV